MKERKMTDSEHEQIAYEIGQGMTSGILDSEDGYRVSWELKVEVFKNN